MRRTEREQWRDIVKDAKRPWKPLVKSTPQELARGSRQIHAAWKNNRYVVMEFASRQTPFGTVRHFIIERSLAEPIHNWNDLQRIKNELCGEEALAIEMYPSESKKVNDFHCYHLWILPEGYALPGVGLNGLEKVVGQEHLHRKAAITSTGAVLK